jgi:hypothetical protein
MEIIINGQGIAVEKEVLEQAIADGKLDISNEDLVVFAKVDFEKRQKIQFDNEYNKGKKAGIEMTASDIKEKYGLESVEGKDFDKIFEAFKENTLKEAKAEPNAKIKELEEDLSKTRQNLKKELLDKENLKKEYETKEKRSKIETGLFGFIPEQAVNEKFNRNDLLALYKANGFDADLSEDGRILAVKNGEIMKNEQSLEPLEAKDVLIKFIESKGLITLKDTKDPKDNTPKGTTSLEKFYKEMEGKPQSEIVVEMQKRIANKTLTV